jgi:hypothetical protein
MQLNEIYQICHSLPDYISRNWKRLLIKKLFYLKTGIKTKILGTGINNNSIVCYNKDIRVLIWMIIKIIT